jgi:chromosome segregation ATPase
LETANKHLKSQPQVLKESETALQQAQQKLREAKQQGKANQTKATKKQIEQATAKVKRAKQKMQQAQKKYAELENRAIELRLELKETKKQFPEYGLSKDQKDEQFTKFRDPQSSGAQRVEVALMKKTTCVLNMLKRAIKRGFCADYVLTDSWFCHL